MPRVYNKVGFAVSTETSPGIWTQTITERYYYGELTNPISKWRNSGGANDNLGISCQISIVCDPFATEHFHQIKYIEFMGVKWKVDSVEIQRPRLILSLGGEYNAG